MLMPVAFRQFIVLSISSDNTKFLITDLPRHIEANIKALCDIDLSPSKLILPIIFI